MLKRHSGLILPTRAAAPGFRVELRGTAFCLVATGSWTVRETASLEKGLKRLRVPIPPTPDFTGEMDISGIEQLDTAGATLLSQDAGVKVSGGASRGFPQKSMRLIARGGYGNSSFVIKW